MKLVAGGNAAGKAKGVSTDPERVAPPADYFKI